MKAIILASGVGKRLRPLTDDKPKSLVKINEKTIIEYQLDILINCGIKNVVITTGPFEFQVKELLQDKYPDMGVVYVNNPKYAQTNYIYSLWLTRGLIDDDIILIHGDLIFTKDLLEKLLEAKGNVVLVNKSIDLPKKDFKAAIDDNRVEKIGVDFFGKNTFFSLPFYKFGKKDFSKWMRAIDIEIKKGNVYCYAEDAFNEISDEIILRPLYFKEEIGMEIDDVNDLRKARDLLEVHKVL